MQEQTKRAPVDVLAVMEDAAAGLRMGKRPRTADKLNEARTAVAALVEADREFDKAYYAHQLVCRHDHSSQRTEQAQRWNESRAALDAARDRRRAALAKFGGA